MSSSSTQSRISPAAPMAKRTGEIDNHFSPSSQDQGSPFTLVFGAVLVALVLSAWALGRVIGGL